MPKLNFYDTDAVKAFTLDVLVEGAETRRDLDFERRQSAAAFSTLSNLLEARKNGVEVGWRDVDRVVADALDILKGGKAE